MPFVEGGRVFLRATPICAAGSTVSRRLSPRRVGIASSIVTRCSNGLRRRRSTRSIAQSRWRNGARRPMGSRYSRASSRRHGSSGPTFGQRSSPISIGAAGISSSRSAIGGRPSKQLPPMPSDERSSGDFRRLSGGNDRSCCAREARGRTARLPQRDGEGPRSTSVHKRARSSSIASNGSARTFAASS